MRIRKLNHSDIDPFHEMQSDIDVMQYVGNKVNSLEENIIDLKEVIDAYDRATLDFLVWAIDNIESGALLGTLALVKDKEDNWEIGFRFLKKYWRQGYGSEVVQGMLSFCETLPYIDNLIAYVDLRNVASQKVLSKSGFVNLGIKYNDEEDCEDYIFSVSTT